MSDMPPEIQMEILRHVRRSADLASMARVSSKWTSISLDVLWSDNNINIRQLEKLPRDRKQMYAAKIRHLTCKEQITSLPLDIKLPHLENLSIDGPIQMTQLVHLASPCLTNLSLTGWVGGGSVDQMNELLRPLSDLKILRLRGTVARFIDGSTLKMLASRRSLSKLSIGREYQVSKRTCKVILKQDSSAFRQLSGLAISTTPSALSILSSRLGMLTRLTLRIHTSTPGLASLSSLRGLQSLEVIFSEEATFSLAALENISMPGLTSLILSVEDTSTLDWDTPAVSDMRTFFSSFPDIKKLKLALLGDHQINQMDILCILTLACPRLETVTLHWPYEPFTSIFVRPTNFSIDDLWMETGIMLRHLKMLKVSNLHLDAGLWDAARLPADRACLARKLVDVFRNRFPVLRAFSDVYLSELGSEIGKYMRQ